MHWHAVVNAEFCGMLHAWPVALTVWHAAACSPHVQALVLAGADPRGVLAAIEAQAPAAPDLQ